MNTTDRLLDQAKENLGITSDYALAKHWNLTTQRISLWRRGDSGLSDDRALQICEMIGTDPGPVLLELQAERAALDLDQNRRRHQSHNAAPVMPWRVRVLLTGCNDNNYKKIMRPSTAKRLPLAIAKPKLGRWRRKDSIPLPLPGFDAPQVTQDDVDRWLIAVPRMDPASPRAAAYVRGYDVAGKIAAAKASGQFERIVDGRQYNELDTWPKR